MMAQALSLESPNEVDAALSRVLDAERAAQADIELARAEAADIGEAARAAVRDLDARTERRIRRMRAAFAGSTDHAVAELERAAAQTALAEGLSADDKVRIARAVSHVAQLLTGSKS